MAGVTAVIDFCRGARGQGNFLNRIKFNSTYAAASCKESADNNPINLVLCLLVCHVTAWINQFDQAFTFTCPAETSLVHVVSSHDNHFEDRVWDFSCRAPPHNDAKMTNCEWSGYVNEFDQPLTFQCARDGIIAGISSVHDNHDEDRRFKFYCCDVPGYITGSCYFTPYVNNFDEHMDYVVPVGKVMRGVDSYHDNGKEDRRFKFEICDLDEHVA